LPALGPLYRSTARAAEPAPFRIGTVGGLTGAVAGWAQASIIVNKYIVEEVNRSGGIKSMGGAKLEYVYADCESDPKKMVTEMEKMLTLRKPHVIATAGSSALTKPALPVLLRYKVPLVSREYSDELLQMNNPFFFMPMPKITVNAKAMADAFVRIGKAKNQPVKRVAILCQDGSFGEMASDVLGKYFPTQGVTVVANEIYPTGKVADFSDTISKFKALNADALVCSTTPYESALIVRAMKAVNFNPLGYAFSCTCIDTVDFANLGKDGDFAFGVPVFAIDAIGDRIKGAVPFLNQFYSKVTSEADRKLCSEKVVLECALLMGIAIQALENAKSYDPMAIRDAMAKLDLKTGDRYIYWPDGVKFDETGYNVKAQTIGGQYQGMKLKIMFPDALVAPNAPAVWPMPKWTDRAAADTGGSTLAACQCGANIF
ncbi:MAG TPA: ABC transporter substrate-binding protein, partial [Candidatus Sulfotelmatobacter sp.]|nr:ABC transporter substrate-binding protein [Candidatus Sulfotelmatobacter sp.]